MGNSLVFTTPGGPTVTATAWYVNGNGSLEQASLGQYSSGLGVCYLKTSCTQQMSFDEYILLQFSKPIDPTSITIKGSSGSGMDVSYWLGGTTSSSVNLTNQGLGSLTSLGFGAMTDADGSGSTSTIDFTGGAPTGTVNAILFGTKYGYDGNNFDMQGMSGSMTSSVPEPSSVILLFTVVLLGLRLSRKAVRNSPLVKRF